MESGAFSTKRGTRPFRCCMTGSAPFPKGWRQPKKNGKWGFLDPEGHIVLPFEYDSTVGEGFSDGLVPVRQNGREGYMDKNPTHGDFIGSRICGRVWFSQRICPRGGGSGFQPESRKRGRRESGAETAALRGDRPGGTDCGSGGIRLRADPGRRVCHHGLDGRKRFLDPDGQTVLAADFEEMGDFSEGLAAIKRDGAYGYADKTGQVVIPCAYSAAGGFHEGYAAVRKDGRYGYIDRTGATVVPFIYDTAARFCDGAAAVRKDGGWGIWQIETRGG